MKLHYDSRWSGDHGIGRFSRELGKRLKVNVVNVKGNPSSPFDPLRLMIAVMRINGASVFLSPGYNAPLFSLRPYVFTLHDLNHIDSLENSTFMKRMYYRFILRKLCRSASAVLTVSEFSRNRIIAWAGVSPRAVFNIGNGVDSSYCEGIEEYKPGFRYVLCISNRRRHKNEERLIRAFAQAQVDNEVRLVFTGNSTDELVRLLDELAISDRVEFLGRVPETELPALYRGALALLFPSLYEGFGLPVVEAMACGTPVLTSNTTSLPEIAGGAAMLVNPLSVDEIAAGIGRILNDPVEREALRDKGLRRAAQFSWDDVARKALLAFSESGFTVELSGEPS